MTNEEYRVLKECYALLMDSYEKISKLCDLAGKHHEELVEESKDE